MTTLRDALAAEYASRLDVRYGSVETWGAHLADDVLSDPAFREALVESVAEAVAMHPLDGYEWAEDYRADARAIVERVLP